MATSRLLYSPHISQARTRLINPLLSQAKLTDSYSADKKSTFYGSSVQSGKTTTMTTKSPHLTAKVSATSAEILYTASSEKKISHEGVNLLLQIANLSVNPLQVQMFFERIIVNSRFFTLLAVAGSLFGSILCFIEGFLIVLQSYSQYLYKVVWNKPVNQANIVKLVISAIYMFLVGTAMIVLGIGIYVMFIDPNNKNTSNSTNRLPKSTMFSLFRLRRIPSWLEIKSVSQAKTRLGHAVVMLLLVGILEKFDSIPLVTGFDLACFAAAIMVSSASIFLLSKLAGCTKQ